MSPPTTFDLNTTAKHFILSNFVLFEGSSLPSPNDLRYLVDDDVRQVAQDAAELLVTREH